MAMKQNRLLFAVYELMTGGYVRQSIGIKLPDIPRVVVNLCTKFVMDPVYENEADDPVNFISDLDRKESDRYKEKGNRYFKAKELNQAIIKYTTAIRFNPNNHLLFSNRAYSHYLLSNYDDALVDIKQCVSIEPPRPREVVRVP